MATEPVYTHGQNNYYEYDGLSMVKDKSPPELIEEVTKFDSFRDDDYVVYTYPKAGTYPVIIIR